jgi:UDP-N-acetyl-D-glucosamine/UDP-N-acetyl-D-galactosamine dehydrogenase
VLPLIDGALRLAVIGLGYVGLPLAVAFARHFNVVGYDLDPARVTAIDNGIDGRGEVSKVALQEVAGRFKATGHLADLAACQVFIVAVPTPVDRHQQPDLTPLREASRAIAPLLKAGAVVIYESTVFPGATEEICQPILEEFSGLICNRDLFIGYSPERINPGDSQHTLTNTIKITSGSTPMAAEFVDRLYRTIITAGTCPVASIRIAEAAKVIENTQRDVNIALMNELALIFHRLGIDTEGVLQAAGTKWNFLRFTPGLVGCHCIGVDPYYLTHKAQEAGHQPVLIPASRLINEGMAVHIAQRVVKLMASRHLSVVGSRILILGLTFKENCADLRNTKVVDIVRELEAYHAEVAIHDPWADPVEAAGEYGLTLVANPPEAHYTAVIVAVAHRQFRQLGAVGVRRWLQADGVLFDVKYLYPASDSDGRL